MSDFDDMYDTAEAVSNDDGGPREGRFWVRKHNHEIVGLGDESRPDGPGIVLRRYFSDLETGIATWGRFQGLKWKVEKAREMVTRVSEAESASFRECFFTEQSGVPGDYLAVVMDKSRSGRLWLRKTSIHTAVHVAETNPTDVRDKKFFVHNFADYRSTSGGSHATATKRPVCRFTNYVVPYSGICECGEPECEYSEV